jgi:hypothetical protein
MNALRCARYLSPWYALPDSAPRNPGAIQLISHILRKDWKLLWPMVALVTAIQMAFEWVGYFQDTPSAAVLLRPLILAWYTGIAALAAAVVLQDPVPGADQDWLIRPLKRKDMVMAKLAFVALAVCVPMFAVNLAHALALGFPFALSLGLILFKEIYVFACFILPVTALAAATRNMTEVIIVGALLVVVYALSVTVGAYFMGAEWCPTCDSGITWLQHVLQHAEILVGAGVILVLQYYRRRTEVARALAVFGALALVFVQLPWNAAFAAQGWLTGSSGAATAITLERGPQKPAPEVTDSAGRDKDHGARHAATLLLQGHPDQALEYWRRRGTPAEAPAAVELPVRAAGVSTDELLLVDRLEFKLFADDDRLLYRRANADVPLMLLAPQPGTATDESGFTNLSVDVPGSVYRKLGSGAARLQMDYSLTLMQAVAQYKMAARDGLLRAPDIGLCSSQYDQDSIAVRCSKMGRSLFCYSATLFDPDGRHNPEIVRCIPDYRPYLPPLTNIVNFFGIDLPVRDPYGLAHYAVDPSELASSYIVVKIYGERDHFKRTLAVSPFRLSAPQDR